MTPLSQESLRIVAEAIAEAFLGDCMPGPNHSLRMAQAAYTAILELPEMVKQREEMVRLRTYTMHLFSCNWHNDGGECTCGLSKALAVAGDERVVANKIMEGAREAVADAKHFRETGEHLPGVRVTTFGVGDERADTPAKNDLDWRNMERAPQHPVKCMLCNAQSYANSLTQRQAERDAKK